MKNVFVVTADGYFDSYGSEVYLIGVFDNYEDAKTTADNCGGVLGCTIITEIEFNQAFPLKSKKIPFDGEKSNDYFLGGYCE